MERSPNLFPARRQPLEAQWYPKITWRWTPRRFPRPKEAPSGPQASIPRRVVSGDCLRYNPVAAAIQQPGEAKAAYHWCIRETKVHINNRWCIVSTCTKRSTCGMRADTLHTSGRERHETHRFFPALTHHSVSILYGEGTMLCVSLSTVL